MPQTTEAKTKERLEGFRASATKLTQNFEARVSELTKEHEAELTEVNNRVSILERFPEPKIGPGQMPYLIGVEWYTASGLRTHGHIYGRTRRAQDDQVWRLYDDQGEIITSLKYWGALMMDVATRFTNQSFRLFQPTGFTNLAEHCSLDGTTTELPSPESELRKTNPVTQDTVAVKQEPKFTLQASAGPQAKASFVPERINILVTGARLAQGDVLIATKVADGWVQTGKITEARGNRYGSGEQSDKDAYKEAAIAYERNRFLEGAGYFRSAFRYDV